MFKSLHLFCKNYQKILELNLSADLINRKSLATNNNAVKLYSDGAKIISSNIEIDLYKLDINQHLFFEISIDGVLERIDLPIILEDFISCVDEIEYTLSHQRLDFKYIDKEKFIERMNKINSSMTKLLKVLESEL